ncbi:hypothetical protein KWH75_06880 [Morganella morganii]|uniref:hypothetical protein n=1 Tax=Morganella morganii TaxID=582 RepID=UPI0021D1C121|nr:hypothetical protein [Morganella morganii]MCU6236792.1 hypothetical protein [Morganella morganii]
MNQQLPVKDITYGTKRHGERSYKAALTFLSMMGRLKLNSATVVKINGDTFISNPVKTNTRNGVVVFSDQRMLIAEIAWFKTTIRQEFNECDSTINGFDKSTLPVPKTFHLILKKAYTVNKDVAIFMKDGSIIKGFARSHDFDSVMLKHSESDFTIIMYDAVKRIVPLEADGSLSE